MGIPANATNFKRKYPRRIYSGAVGVIFHGKYEVTQGVSLGEGGMAFLWPHPLPTEESAVVTFKVPGDSMLSIRGEIRNAKKSDQFPNSYVIGIQFLPLPIAEKRRIRAFVSSRDESEPII
jgi:hypothetical protein